MENKSIKNIDVTFHKLGYCVKGGRYISELNCKKCGKCDFI